jgi:serine/threonine protein kinase
MLSASCLEAEVLLAERAGGLLAADESSRLRDHLATCETCAELADTLDHTQLPIVDQSAYAISREIARGGMGRILAARDLRVGRDLLIKELLSEGTTAAARFEREARLTARLQHPNIVPIYEIGRWPSGRPFYAMRRVPGRSFQEVLAETATMGARLALLPHLLAAADAVAYAHEEGVIHRDLTPANVMVGTFGETEVIDWGLAKDLRPDEGDHVGEGQGDDDHGDEDDADIDAGPFRAKDAGGALTRAGDVMGTAAYMPPEQAAGARVDERADVYALGAMLYHLLAGHPPYRGATREQILAALKEGPPPPLPPAAPRDLVSVAAKAMAREPAARYPNARGFVEELHRFQTGQLVAAHDYSALERAARWLRRHRGVAIASGAFAIVIAVTGALAVRSILVQKRVAQHQRDLALSVGVEWAKAWQMSEETSTTILEDAGREAWRAHDAKRALAYLAEAYADGADDDELRRLLRASARAVGNVPPDDGDLETRSPADMQAIAAQTGLHVEEGQLAPIAVVANETPAPPDSGRRGDRSNPGTSCLDILDAGASRGNGAYWIATSRGPTQVTCEMTIDGGGWTQLVDPVAADLSSDVTHQYLYLWNQRWYESPPTTLTWSWNFGRELTGTYTYFDGSQMGSVTCTGSADETPLFGVGCSDGPGPTTKVLPYYVPDAATGRAEVCQNLPGAFQVPACTPPMAVDIFGR